MLEPLVILERELETEDEVGAVGGRREGRDGPEDDLTGREDFGADRLKSMGKG